MAIEMIQDQVEVIDLIGETSSDSLENEIKNLNLKNVDSFGEPYIALRIEKKAHEILTDKRALHSKIILNYMGKVMKRE